MCAYAHADLDNGTISLSSFSSGTKLYELFRVFYDPKGLPNLFPKQMESLFQKFLDQGNALVYVDDILLFAHIKTHVLDLIK